MKFAVIQFPGSNCDQDCLAAINGLDGLRAEYVWHKETSLDDFDAIVLPGGFAYGDYLRCGAIARFSPIMRAVISDAHAGKLVLGTCNGFQVLCEAGLLPGALVRNRSLRFVCDMVTTRVEVDDSPFTHGCPKGTLLHLPVAHGEGCFFADAETLRDLNANRQVILRYADNQGRNVPEANPNGSIENIAGVCNRERNVFGLMPHPDRASDSRLGSVDGTRIFRSMMQKRELEFRNFLRNRKNYDSEFVQEIEPLFDALGFREKKIIFERFGLRGGKPKTLEEVGKKWGVTRERIRQLQNIALSKLRRAYNHKTT